MRIILLMMCLLLYISNAVRAQTSQTVISLESRVGYSTNTYLNPFFSEWDRSVNSGYGSAALFGQSFWQQGSNLFDVSGGFIVEPFLDNRGAWKGGFGTARYQRRLSGKFMMGLESGASYFASSFDRGMIWIQPTITWSPGPFTLVRIKAGSNFRSYRNYADGQDSFTTRRLDLYALELETWPTFHWNLQAGLYGQLETLPSVHKGFSSAVSAGYMFANGSQIKVQAGLQQYSQTVTTTTGGDGGPGFPPGGPPQQPTQTETTETDRIARFGITADYPLNRKWSLFARADRLNYYASSTNEQSGDVHLSGGVRFSFEPRIGRGGNTVLPEWDNNEENQVLRIRYKGEGRLYISGDFNNWKQPGIPLTEQTDNTFVARLNLEPGAYEYKILHVHGSDEEWIELSKDSYTVADGFGGRNALLLVE